jgi:hypothetical protein
VLISLPLVLNYCFLAVDSMASLAPLLGLSRPRSPRPIEWRPASTVVALRPAHRPTTRGNPFTRSACLRSGQRLPSREIDPALAIYLQDDDRYLVPDVDHVLDPADSALL